MIFLLARLLKCLRQYKKETIFTLIFIIGETVIEVLIPFITAELVNNIDAGARMSDITRTGIILAVMALTSLACGAIAAFACSKASTGFAKNLRSDIFKKIQSYSFENIDKFSSSSLVTRMTTDVANVQMAFMMLIRLAIRCPLMLVFAVIMAYIMGGALAGTFIVVIPVLATGLLLIAKFAMPAFRRVFKKYDRLNESIEENVRAMRVVKGFSREEYEKKKFKDASSDICGDFTRAERIVALETPIMQVCLYFNMVFVLFVGSKLTITSGGELINVGQISAMLTYGMQILMSLMMLSFVYVMITMSAESAKRIYEVLQEVPALSSPADAKYEIEDGSIRFENVSFKYSKKATEYALSDINFEIKSGMTVGIVGTTGC